MDMNSKHYYTDEKNTLILISLLKQHNIRKVIASPGTTNISFIGSIQYDSFFEIYSAVDERAASFMACGLAEESGEPVVLSCTGATASRNYIPGLTEAYYRRLPVLAVTSSQHEGRIGNYVAQMIDRRAQFKDMIKKSVQAYSVASKEDENRLVTSINDALLELNHNNPGPVHINLFTTYSNKFAVESLPKYRMIRRIKDNNFPEIPEGRIGIFIGAHTAFTDEETKTIDDFCESNNAVVICDHISNYRGKYRFLCSLVNNQSVDLGVRNYDLIIYIGYVHGTYLWFGGKQLWRVNPDGEVRDPYENLTYVFEMTELEFFKHYVRQKQNNEVLNQCNLLDSNARKRIPELPFSNIWVAQQTAGIIPKNSILHLSILNTLRAWNYFETDESVLCYSNSGGYGIDGCLSSFMGSAISNRDKNHYLIIGDLSFFYDVDTIFSEIPSNIHIMLINNGVGTEFKNYSHRAARFGEDANSYMAAKGHNGFKNHSLVKNICASVNMSYHGAYDKQSFMECLPLWISPQNGPTLLEVFTSDDQESLALNMISNLYFDNSIMARVKKKVDKAIKKVKRKCANINI